MLLAGIFLAASAAPAEAHKMNVFAYADGRSISGEAYARGGSPIKAARVTAFDPAGEILAETTTDDAGKFTFPLKFLCDHRIEVDAGDGHSAEFTVGADELPTDLAPRGAVAERVEPACPQNAAEVSPGPVDTAPPPAADDRSLDGRIAAVDRQIKELRRDLNRYQSQLRVQDVVGAVGYILGLMGFAYYLGVKRKERAGRDG
jgi:nickel transport protein